MKNNKEVGWIFGLLAIGMIMVTPFVLIGNLHRKIRQALTKIGGNVAEDEARKRTIDYGCDEKDW